MSPLYFLYVSVLLLERLLESILVLSNLAKSHITLLVVLINKHGYNRNVNCTNRGRVSYPQFLTVPKQSLCFETVKCVTPIHSLCYRFLRGRSSKRVFSMVYTSLKHFCLARVCDGCFYINHVDSRFVLSSDLRSTVS